MSKKRNKRNTENFRKKLNKKKQRVIQLNKKRTKTSEIDFIDLVDSFNKKYNDVFDRSKPNKSEILECTPLSELESDLQDTIQYQLDKTPIYSGECHLTSWMVSGLSPKISSVKGWGVSEYESFEEFCEIKEKSGFKVKSYKKLNDGWIKGFHSTQVFWYDTNTNRYFFIHSWNEINNVHFDVQLHCHDEFFKEIKKINGNNVRTPKYRFCIPKEYTSTSEFFGKEKELGIPTNVKTKDGSGLLEYTWNHRIKTMLKECNEKVGLIYIFNKYQFHDDGVEFNPQLENRIRIKQNQTLQKVS
tara:strand:- start:80 stop:982 length:903 start_codon:yes stop_codon:yes gene_type:complete